MRATAAPRAWYGADHGHLALFVYASSNSSEGMSTLFFLEVLSCVHVTLGSVVERVTLGPGKAPPGSLTGPQRAHWQRRRRGHHLVVLCRVRAYRGLACICTDSAGSCWVLCLPGSVISVWPTACREMRHVAEEVAHNSSGRVMLREIRWKTFSDGFPNLFIEVGMGSGWRIEVPGASLKCAPCWLWAPCSSGRARHPVPRHRVFGVLLARGAPV